MRLRPRWGMSTNPGSNQPMGGFAPRALLEDGGAQLVGKAICEGCGAPINGNACYACASVPAHYDYGAYEPMLVADAWGLSLRLGYSLKYICRRGNKEGGDLLEDLRKA